jgi:Cu/Zn superoxide dismutase
VRVRAVTVVALIVAGSLIVAKEAQRGHATGVKTVVAAVQLGPEDRSGVRGVAFFRQRGQRLSGWVAVWGLRPRTAHAVHFHAPGRCGGAPADPVTAHNDLVANGAGVAYATFAVQVKGQVLRQGVYYNVHRRPATAGKSPSVACGDVRPEENGG